MRLMRDIRNVLLSIAGLELANDTKAKFTTLRDLVKALYEGEAENVTKLDYLEVEAYIGLISTRVNEMEKNVVLSKAALRQTIGLDDSVKLETSDTQQS